MININDTDKEKYNNKTRKMVEIAMLAAIATVLMFFEFPLPFVPPFYKIDLSELPALVGGFAFGPISAVLIEMIKVLLHIVTRGTQTMWVGEIANFVIGCSLVLPASILYKKQKSKQQAVLAMSIGTIIMSVFGSVFNAYVLLPAYAKMYGIQIETVIKMGTQINSRINNLFSFVVFAIVPFNLLKGTFVSLITIIIYKKIRMILK